MSPAGLTSARHSSIGAAPHQLVEAKADKWTNNNTCANNKQTTQGGMCTGGSVELCGDGVQCAMHQSTWKGSGDVSEICGKALETYWRYIGESTKVDSTGRTLTIMHHWHHLPRQYTQDSHHPHCHWQ